MQRIALVSIIIFLSCTFVQCLSFYRSPQAEVSSSSANQLGLRMSGVKPGSQYGALVSDPNSFIDLDYEDLSTSNSSGFFCILSAVTFTLLPCWFSEELDSTITLSMPEISRKKFEHKNQISRSKFIWLPFILIGPFINDEYPADAIDLALHEKNAAITADARKLKSELEKTANKVRAFKKNPKLHPVILSRFSVYGVYDYYGITTGQVGGNVEVSIINNSRKTIKKTEYTFYPGMFTFSIDKKDLKTLTSHETIPPGQMNRNKRMSGANSKGSSFGLGITKLKVYYSDGTSRTLNGPHLESHGIQLPDRFVESLE